MELIVSDKATAKGTGMKFEDYISGRWQHDKMSWDEFQQWIRTKPPFMKRVRYWLIRQKIRLVSRIRNYM